MPARRLGTRPPRPGRHRAEIIGEDVAGNQSVLTFDFVWEEEGSGLSRSTPCEFNGANANDFEIDGYDVTEFGLVAEISRNDSMLACWCPAPAV